MKLQDIFLTVVGVILESLINEWEGNYSVGSYRLVLYHKVIETVTQAKLAHRQHTYAFPHVNLEVKTSSYDISLICINQTFLKPCNIGSIGSIYVEKTCINQTLFEGF